MRNANILLIESDRANAPSFAPALEKKGYDLIIKHNVDAAINSVVKKSPDLIVLDAASMRTPGTRMCQKVRGVLNGVPIILVTPEGSDPNLNSGASLALAQPLTYLSNETLVLPSFASIYLSQSS